MLGLLDGGVRNDTITIRPMRIVGIEFDTDNPGRWVLRCHNAYHREAELMTTVSYRTQPDAPAGPNPGSPVL